MMPPAADSATTAISTVGVVLSPQINDLETQGGECLDNHLADHRATDPAIPADHDLLTCTTL